MEVKVAHRVIKGYPLGPTRRDHNARFTVADFAMFRQLNTEQAQQRYTYWQREHKNPNTNRTIQADGAVSKKIAAEFTFESNGRTIFFDEIAACDEIDYLAESKEMDARIVVLEHTRAAINVSTHENPYAFEGKRYERPDYVAGDMTVRCVPGTCRCSKCHRGV